MAQHEGWKAPFEGSGGRGVFPVGLSHSGVEHQFLCLFGGVSEHLNVFQLS